MKPRNNKDKDEYCIYDGRLLNNLGYGEYFCKRCGKFFKNGREIEYTENGDIIYKRNTVKKDKEYTKQMEVNKETDRNNRRTWNEIKTKAKENIYNWNDLIEKSRRSND